MVPGPIERGRHLIPQLEADAISANLSPGRPRLMLVGFFKKVFVADNCAILANYAFDPSTYLNGYWAVLGVVAFAFQIYGDFSGYTDIARGSAKLLGIDLVENFQFPYFSRNPSEFWGRWHISLSTWFRDYLYIPLGGNRGARWETLRNLGVIMLLAGLWHGASWIFVLWGAYQGRCSSSTAPPLNWLSGREDRFSWRSWLALPLMWVFILVGWAIFRSADLHQLGAWFAALGHWQLPGSTLAVVLPLAAAPHRAPVPAADFDLEVSGRNRRPHMPWAVGGLFTLLLLLMMSRRRSTTRNSSTFSFPLMKKLVTPAFLVVVCFWAWPSWGPVFFAHDITGRFAYGYDPEAGFDEQPTAP